METEGPIYLGGSGDVWVGLSQRCQRVICQTPAIKSGFSLEAGRSSIVLPPNSILILHLFTANRTSDVLQPHLSSADALPHPQSHPPFSPPHHPAHFQQVCFKHSNLSQQIRFHFPRSPKSGRRKISRKQRISLPAVPIYHPQAAPGWSPGTWIHPHMHPPCTANPASAHAPT